jgi:hypothetical protein
MPLSDRQSKQIVDDASAIGDPRQWPIVILGVVAAVAP